MGKHGPCHHCGVTSTPLWRNGPPNKPVLCNACGSRWRTKGSLANYTPLHAREATGSEETKVARVKSTSLKPNEKKLQKIKQGSVDAKVEHKREIPYSDQNFQKVLEGDTSNRSSSGSATSFSESCTHFGTTEASELAGSAQSNVWESQVPSKKRTCVIRTNPSPAEKLTKDLHTIMHEQQQSSNYFSSSSDLLYESETHLGSLEIGNGSVLLRYPNSKTVEEESEASSLPIDNKELKDIKGKQSNGGQEVVIGPNFLGHSNLPSLKRSRENLHVPELKGTMRSPKRLAKSDGSGPNPDQSSLGSKFICDNPEDVIDNDGACFSPRTFFASPPARCSLQFTDNDESSDHDLLLDFPFNNSAFPEAELLYHPWNQKPAAPNNSFAESVVVAVEKEETNFTKSP